MVKAERQDEERKVADEAASISRLADASARLFAEQAAAMAVFTAYGMSMATQITGMMLGALRGPAEGVKAKESDAQPVAGPGSNVVHLRPGQAATSEAIVKTRARKPSVPKPASRRVATAEPTGRKAAAQSAAAAKTRTGTQPTSASGDDLKKISGIGPRLERVLNDRGILRFADIASLGKTALKNLDDELGLDGRVIRDDWAGQARALSGGKG